ncbi:unnamed protein product [Timema podura]|uniref:Uncharacterized protein n=1 Tax=Timema podura TaxID=61482 RepID=A0ABN7P949_TIMPD|nr:unnamed protein product [Timema podura]
MLLIPSPLQVMDVVATECRFTPVMLYHSLHLPIQGTYKASGKMSQLMLWFSSGVHEVTVHFWQHNFGGTLLSYSEDKYDPDVNPTVTSSFITAAFRFGHSLLPNVV